MSNAMITQSNTPTSNRMVHNAPFETKSLVQKTRFKILKQTMLAVFLLLGGLSAHAQTTYYWVGGTAQADFNAGGSWSTIGVGGAAVGGTITVNANNIYIVDGSDISSAAGLQTGNVTIQMTADRTIGQLQLVNSASLTLSGLTTTRTLQLGSTNASSLAGDELLIESGSTLTLGTNANLTLNNTTGTDKHTANIAGSFTINTDRIYTYSSTESFTLPAGASITVNGTYTQTIGAHTNNGTMTISGTYTQNANGFTNNGTWNQTAGTHTVESAAGNTFINNNSYSNAGALALSNLNSFFTNNATVTLNGTATGTGTFTNAVNSTLTLSITPFNPTLIASAAPNLVHYNASSNQAVKPTTYHNLTISGSGVKTLGAVAITINNDFRILGTAVFADNGQTVTGSSTGTFEVADGAVYRTTRTGTSWFPSNYTAANINFNTTGGFEYAGVTAHNIPSTPVTSYGTLIISASPVKTLTAATTVNSLAINGGTLADGGFQITGSASGTLNVAANATLRLGSTTVATTFPLNFVSANVTLANTSTVNYNSNLPQTISTVPTEYGSISTSSTAAVVKSFAANTILNGTLTNGSNNTLDLGNFTITIRGGTQPINNSGTIGGTSLGSATVRFEGTAVMSNITQGGTFSPLFNLEAANTVAAGMTQTGSNFPVHNFTLFPGATWNLGSQTLNVSGNFTNQGTMNGPSGTARINFNGSTLQTFTVGTFTSGALSNLTINNAAGVDLVGNLTIPTNITFTNGTINTSAGNLLTLNSGTTLTTPSSSSYINGPARRFFAAGVGPFIVPVGQGGVYSPVQLNDVSGTQTLIEVTPESTVIPGTLFAGVTSVLTNRHWNLNVIGVNSITGYRLQLTQTGETYGASNKIVRNDAGLVVPYPSTGSGASVQAATGNVFGNTFGLFSISTVTPVSGTVTVGPTGTYQKLYLLAQALNGLGVSGPVVAEMLPDYDGTTGEIFPINFNAISGVSATDTVYIRPALGASNLITSGAATGSLINFSSCTWLRFDGRPGGIGTSSQWSFRNSSGFPVDNNVFAFTNGTQNVSLRYLDIQGTNQNNTNGGVLRFGPSATGTANNQNILVEHCDIHNITGQEMMAGITSSNTGSFLNTLITIRNNNIYDFHVAIGDSRGINLVNNSTRWSINGNSFYQTTNRTTSNQSNSIAIHVQSGAAGAGNEHNVTNNFIGGTQPECGGSAYTVTTPQGFCFTGIAFASPTANANIIISDNTIRNFNIQSSRQSNAAIAFNSNIFLGIFINGSAVANGSTISGNTIGSMTTTGSIVTDYITNGGESRIAAIGVVANNTGSHTITNNNIGGFTLNATSNRGHSFTGIFVTASTNLTCTGNTIGGTVANSINLTGSAPFDSQPAHGIWAACTSTANVSNNTVRNITNNNSETIIGTTTGIFINNTSGAYTVSNNTITNMSTRNRANGSNLNSAIVGISFGAATPANNSNTISGNTIHSLANLNTNSPAAGNNWVLGINYQGGTSGAQLIERNNIHSLTSNLPVSDATTGIFGINVNTGTGLNIVNNMIRLGIDAAGNSITLPHRMAGIRFTPGVASNMVFNSIYIGGTSVTSGFANNSACIQRNVNSGAQVIRNNILVNERSNSTGTGFHTAFEFSGTTALTATNVNNNLFNVTGAGGVVARVGTTNFVSFCDWLANGFDANSSEGNPAFINATGNAALVDLHISPTLPSAAEGMGDITGLSGVWLNIDLDGQTRSGLSPVDVGADAGDFVSGAPTLAGSFTVGTGGNYLSLTGPCGLFNAINTSILTGNITVNVISDITEPGTFALNQWSESGVGGYTLTIQSDGTARVLSGSYSGSTAANNGLFRLNGADRVTINGGTAAQRLLTFRNTNTTSLNATWHLSNDAQDIQFNNLIIEGGASSTLASGVVLIGSGATGGSGNDNINILRCNIRDLSTATSYPRNGIYAAGTSATIANDNVTVEDCIIFNFYSAGQQSSGVRVETFNAGWTIKNNDFYQTVTHNATASTEQYVIYVNTSSGQITVDGNRIGGSAANLSGNWQISPAPTAPSTYRFVGIWQNAAPTIGHQIINNQIGKMVMQTSSGANTNYGVFSGIYVAAGNSNITGNTIGADNVDASTAAGANIDFGSNSNGAVLYGIRNIGTGTLLIDDNKIGGIRFSNATSSATNTGGSLHAISNTAGSATISNNTIGSQTTNNSLVVNGVNATTNPVNLYGIEITSSGASVNNNIIRNLTNGGLTSSGNTHGIRVTGAGAQNVNNNEISLLRGAGTQSSYGTSAAVAGIVLSNSSTTASSVSNNTIFNLTHNAGVANSAKIIGISFDAGNNVNHAVNANTIYGFNSSQNSAGIEHVGIEIGSAAGTMRASNNMIRLGRIADGTEFTNSSSIVGILDQSTAAQNVWFNTVLIDGTAGTGSAANSFAYRRTVNSGADNIRNNIFANNRTGGPSGSIHFAWASNTLGGLTAAAFDNNIFFSANNTEFSVAATPANLSSNADPARRLQALRGNVGLPGNNLRSGIATLSQINFINATGATPNLRLNNANAAAGAGVNIPAVTSDIDGTITRANPPAIGAHEGSGFLALDAAYDIYTPLFSVTSVPTVGLCDAVQTVNITATINDLGTGIATTGANQPHLWWRRSAPSPTAWASVTPITSTGNGNNGTYAFEITINPAVGETYQYYVVAQDEATTVNRWFSHFGANDPVHPSVSVQTTAAASPASFNTISQVPLSGTVTVGSGGDFPSFNANPGGLFNAINTRGLSSDLEVLVISNINELANWTPLNAHQEFCGSGYTITIKPNAATLYTIEANSSAANAMFSFLGARRVVIDGSFDGSGRFLRLRHNRVTSIFASTVEMNNGANNISINNCIIEGANTNLSTNTTGSVGVVRIGGSMGFASGNLNSITIQGNEIRNLSNVSPTLANVPGNLIYMGGANNSANINNITISENDMYNFQTSAIRADNGNSSTSNSIGNNINILNNNIYQELIIPTYQYPIVIDALGNTFGHVISGNKIGGSAKPNPEITGTWQNNKADGEVVAIYANVGNAPTQEQALSIQGNKIQRINISGNGWTNFVGVRVQNGRVNIGNVAGNVIGSEDNSLENIISNGSGGSFLSEDAAVMGIWTQSSEEVVIENNIVSGLSTGLGTFCFMDGIAHGSNMTFNGISYTTPGGKSTIRNNTIANNRSSSNLQNSAVSNEGMISLFVYTNSMENVIEGNLIQNNGLNANSSSNVRNHGVMLGVLGQVVNHGGVFRNNTVAALANANAGAAAPNTAPEINGLVLNHGNWEVSNNMISLRNGTTGTHVDFRNTFVIGIRDHLRNVTGQGANYIHNSVYIYGENGGSGTGNPSYNYLRIPNNTGSVAGAPTTLRNNIFINERTGLGTHRALGNINNSSPATGWNTTASDYNFISTLSAGTATRWGTTDYNFAGWQTQSGGDANSDYKPAAATTVANVQLKPTDLFESDFLFGNLRIAIANTDATDFIAQKGTAVSVTTDIDGDARNPLTPDLGADEFTFPDSDAGITEAIAAFCAGVQNVDVTLNNYGSGPLTSATINWSINGNAQIPFNWTGTIAPGSSAIITIGTFDFIGGVDYTLIAASSNPNGGADADVSNDSYTSAVFSSPTTPVAIIGAAQPCALVENQPYSVAPIAGATTYTWTLPGGWSISSGTGTNAILVNTGNVGQHGNIEVTAGNGVCNSTPQILAVTLPSANAALSGNQDSRTCLVHKNGWINFYDDNGNLIVSVNSLGQNLGNVEATSFVSGAPHVTEACDDLGNPSFMQTNLQRTFVIEPENQPATPVLIRLYALNAEVAAYQNTASSFTTQNLQDDITDLSDLNLSKVSNGAGTGNPSDFCGSGGTVQYIAQNSSGDINGIGFNGFNATAYLEFTINSFSEFFPMSSGNFGSALPVELNHFSANCADDKIQVNWTTASELNASHYILENSRDGVNWSQVAQFDATGTTNQASNYSYTVQNFGSVTYFRLIQIDLDGQQAVYGPISSNCDLENSLMTVHPNPTTENFSVVLQITQNIGNAQVELVDMSGRVIQSQTTDIHNGTTMLNFDVKAIQPGAYMIRVKGLNDKFTPMRVVKM